MWSPIYIHWQRLPLPKNAKRKNALLRLYFLLYSQFTIQYSVGSADLIGLAYSVIVLISQLKLNSP
jgi:hypothetical protein